MQTLKLTKKYEKYPEYKDSGVEWLDNIPMEWSVEKLKHVSIMNSKTLREDTPSDFKFKYFDIGSVDSQSDAKIEDEISFADAPSRARRLVSSGDSIISTVRTYLKAISYFDEVKDNIVASTGFAVMTPKERLHPKYLYYYLLSDRFINQVIVRSKGVSYPAITPIDLKSLEISYPSKKEQEYIASHLDQKVSFIDQIIEKKEKQIELLKEEIVSIAQNEQMNGKGETIRMKDLFKLAKNPIELEDYSEYVALGLYNRGRGLFHKDPQLGKDIRESDFYKVIPRDLIISGQFAWEGAVALASKDESECVVSHRYYLLRDGVVKTEYLLALLMTKFGDHILNESSRGSAGRNRPLNIKILLKEKIRVPSKEVETKIASLLIKMGSIRNNIKKSVELLEEYKSSLISNVVTGKIKV